MLIQLDCFNLFLALVKNFLLSFCGCSLGVRIETTHMATMKRKYTVWGVSESAERLQFDIEDNESKRTTRTTVAQYFFDAYKLRLRYVQGSYRSWKTWNSRNLSIPVSRPGKSWILIVAHGKSWKIMVCVVRKLLHVSKQMMYQ